MRTDIDITEKTLKRRLSLVLLIAASDPLPPNPSPSPHPFLAVHDEKTTVNAKGGIPQIGDNHRHVSLEFLALNACLMCCWVMGDNPKWHGLLCNCTLSPSCLPQPFLPIKTASENAVGLMKTSQHDGGLNPARDGGMNPSKSF